MGAMDTDGFPLPRRILLATDLTSRGDRALERALQLARDCDSELHLVHSPDPAGGEGVAQRRLRRDIGADDAGLHVHLEDAATPAAAVLAVAERIGCELVVMGESRPRFLGGVFEGTLDQVLRRSPASVLVVRDRPRRPYRLLLAGSDFTDEARQALVAAATMFPAASLRLLHAFELPRPSLLADTDEGRAWSAGELAKLRAELDALALPAARKAAIHCSVEAGPPDVMLRRVALEKDVDLVVIGAHPRGLLFDSVVGNSRRIAAAVPGDLLMVRAVRAAG